MKLERDQAHFFYSKQTFGTGMILVIANYTMLMKLKSQSKNTFLSRSLIKLYFATPHGFASHHT